MGKTPVYTLLIVESPVIARHIQNISPSSVYVMATGGFCWHPSYHPKTNTLKAVSDPEKRSFRKELSEQAQWANRIIVATDSDPSGDFIAWSVANYLSPIPVQRAYLKNLTRHSIVQLLTDTRELTPGLLANRLSNRFCVNRIWTDTNNLPDIQLAGICALFGTEQLYTHFLDEDGQIFKSSKKLPSLFNEWHTVQQNRSGKNWVIQKPLSTFDVIEYVFSKKMASSFKDAQSLLQSLFETVLPDTRQSLISYPRTEANGFYSESWNSVKTQFLKVFNNLEFKPNFLQNSIDANSPHESIHPLDLTIHPDHVKGQLYGLIGNLYEWIYQQTVHAITIPDILPVTYSSELNSEGYFYQHLGRESFAGATKSLHPCFTISDFGKALNSLGVCKPSVFGKAMDEWIFKKWIVIDGQVVKPGSALKSQLGRSAEFRHKLEAVQKLLKNEIVSAETVRHCLSS